PAAALTEPATTYPKVALGAPIGLKKAYKLHWAEQCFARIWPKRIHGFGFGGRDYVMTLPFHSIDATNWETGPCRFGNWERYGQRSVGGGSKGFGGGGEGWRR